MRETDKSKNGLIHLTLILSVKIIKPCHDFKLGKSSIQKVSNVSLLSETEINIRYHEVVGCAIGVFVCWGRVGKNIP